MNNISLLFLTKSTPERLEAHHQLGQKVLSIYRILAVDTLSQLEQITWYFYSLKMISIGINSNHYYYYYYLIRTTLQESILKLVVDVVGSANPFSINHIATKSANDIFSYLFIIWIKSPYTTKEMWVQLSEKISKMVQWGDLLNQWKDKILQVTHSMVELFLEAKLALKADKPRQVKKLNEAAKAIPSFEINLVSRERDQHTVKELWFILLNILGNINDITNPENFATSLNCCAEIIDIFLNLEDKFDLELTKYVEIYHIFLPWLLEACNVEEKRNRGRLVAYSTLCKLFCRPTTIQLPVEILVHFYRILKQGLTSNHSSIIWTIFRYASTVFTLSLPGVNILIPDFLRETSKLFFSKSKTTIPPDVQLKALNILTSLISFPDHFKGVTYKYKEDDELKELTMEIFQEKLSATFINALQYDKLTPSNLSYLQYSLTVLVINDLLNTPRKNTINDAIKGILYCCTHAEKKVAFSAIQSMSSLKECYSQLVALDAALFSVVMYTLAENINNLIKQCKLDVAILPDKEGIIVNHFYCLLDWLLVCDIKIIDYAALLEIFEAIELGLIGEVVSTSGTIKEGPQKKKNFIDRLGKSFNPSAAKVKQKAAAILESAANQSAIQTSLKIREASEMFLLTLLVKYNNFPLPEGASEGPGVDDDDENSLYFIYNQKSIFTFKEMIDENKKKFVRVTIRDATGKYTWDNEIINRLDIEYIFKDNNEFGLSNIVHNNDISNVDSIPNDKVFNHNYIRSTNDLPFYKEGLITEGVDITNELIKYLNEVQPQLIPSGMDFQNKNMDKIQKFNELIGTQEEGEVKQVNNFHEEERKDLPLVPSLQVPYSTFHHCRLLLSNFGYLIESSRKILSFLAQGSRFKRSIKQLDQISSRELIKIGLLYVKDGQDRESSILSNEMGSKRYTQFVNQLGWHVNLETHQHYKGGLGKDTGPSALYYSNPLTEVIFHDATLMPSSKSDRQQAHKVSFSFYCYFISIYSFLINRKSTYQMTLFVLFGMNILANLKEILFSVALILTSTYSFTR